MQWRGWKHAPPHMCYHAEFGRSALGIGMNTGEPQKLGSTETLLSLDRGAADPKIHAPPLYLLPRQIW